MKKEREGRSRWREKERGSDKMDAVNVERLTVFLLLSSTFSMQWMKSSKVMTTTPVDRSTPKTRSSKETNSSESDTMQAMSRKMISGE